MITVAFGLLLLSVIPTLLGNSSTIMQAALAQTDEPSPPMPINNTLQAQGSLLPTQEGFSISLLATNFSAPYNILYGPDGVLWITERVGKTFSRVDPNNGSELSIMPVPNVHQSGGQDGLIEMAFDPNFNNTHYIYAAYTYDADPGEELDRSTKITRQYYW